MTLTHSLRPFLAFASILVGLLDAPVALGALPAEIAVFTGASTAATDERTDNTGTVDFGGSVVGNRLAQSFTIQNTGGVPLTGLAVSATGDFSVVPLASSELARNATTTFAVTFSPTAVGARTGVVTILSDDADEGSFEINVSGEGLSVVIPLAPEIMVENTPGVPLKRVRIWGGAEYPPIPEGEDADAVAIAAGSFHLLALKADGTVAVWKQPYVGMLPLVAPPGLTGVKAIAANSSGNVVLKTDGTLVGWGQGIATMIPTDLTDVQAIAVGYNDALALKEDGTVVHWGGDAATYPPPSDLSGVTAISVGVSGGSGVSNYLAVKQDGTVVAWGSNYLGASTVPSDLTDVKAVFAGVGYSLALRNDGTVVSWGSGLGGSVPVGLTDVRTLVAGEDYVLALKNDGTTVAWGFTNFVLDTPKHLQGVQAIASYGNIYINRSAVALAAPQLLWGDQAVATTGGSKLLTIKNKGNAPLDISNVSLVSGDGADFTLTKTSLLASVPAVSGETTFSVSFTPTATGLRNATLRISSNDSDEAAYDITLTGIGLVPAPEIGVERTGGTPLDRLVGWGGGNNRAGNLNTPAGLTNVRAIACGTYCTLALKSDGTVMAWGSNIAGVLDVPVGLTEVTAIAASITHCVALKRDGTVVAWGANDAGIYQSTVPSGLADVVAISTIGNYTLALRSDGQVVAWGNNSNQIVSLANGLTDVKAISAGPGQAAAVKTDGTVVTWGSRLTGMVTVAGLTDVKALATTSNNNLALKNDGTLWLFLGANALSDFPAEWTGLTAIAADGYGIYAIDAAGTLFGWNDVTPAPTGVSAIFSGRSHSYALSEARVAFGDQATFAGADQTFSIKNSGSADLEVSNITLDGANAADFAVSFPAQLVIAPGSSHDITISFRPRSSGQKQATLRVLSNDSDEGVYQISLTGNGIGLSNHAPSFELPPAPVQEAGATWTKQQERRGWRDIAASADGMKLAAVAYEEGASTIHTSTNGGETWDQLSPETTDEQWWAVACSADGSKIFALTKSNGVYVSTDSGATYTQHILAEQMPFNGDWASLACSADGTIIYAGRDGNDTVFKSIDSGTTWSELPNSYASMTAMACSADGQSVAGVSLYGKIYHSSDAGATWVTNQSYIDEESWSAIASSSDGMKLVATSNTGSIYRSVDAGQTWVRSTTVGIAWSRVTSSADGVHLAALGTVRNFGRIADGGPPTNLTPTTNIIYSADSGLTWQGSSVDPGAYQYTQWSGLATSANGQRLIATGSYGYVYTSVRTQILTISANTMDGAFTMENFASQISLGPVNEALQTVTFIVDTDRDKLFDELPAISSAGTLTFTPWEFATGRATITVVARDNGGTENDGTDTSAVQTFIIELYRNSAPTDIVMPRGNIYEHRDPYSVVGYLRGVDPDNEEEEGVDQNTLSLVAGEGDEDNASFELNEGQLILLPVADIMTKPNYHFRVRTTDSRGLTFEKAFVIEVEVFNAPPEYTLSASNPIAVPNSGLNTYPSFATGIRPGPEGTELEQTVSFTLTHDAQDFFTEQPAISPTGTLTFTLAPGASGQVWVQVYAFDSGPGRGNPDLSYTNFTIRILSLMDQWREQHFPPTQEATGNADDPDSDGFINLLEFAFGTDPNDNSSGPPTLEYTGTFAGNGVIAKTGQPIVKIEGAEAGIDVRALFVRRKDHQTARITYTPQFSADLASWQTSTVQPTVLADDGTNQIVSVRYPRFVNGKKAKFFRIRVNTAP